MVDITPEGLIAFSSVVTAGLTVLLVFIYSQMNEIVRQQYRPVLAMDERRFQNDALSIKLANVGHGLARNVRVYGTVYRSAGPKGYFTKRARTRFRFRKFTFPGTVAVGKNLSVSLPVGEQEEALL